MDFFLHAFKGLPRVIWVLSVVSFINRSGSMVVVYLALYLTQFLDYDIVSAGNVLSCYGLGSIAGTFAGGYLTDRLGYYRVMIYTLTLSGLMLLAMPAIEHFVAMCLYTLVLSFVAEAFRPANQISIRTHSTDENRTRSFSLMRVWINLAVTFALAVGGVLAMLGWHWLFLADGITCLGAALLLHVYFSRNGLIPPRGEPRHPRHAVDTEEVAVADGSSPYRDIPFMSFILFTFISALVFMQIVWTIPVFFKEAYGWNESKIGLVSALNGLVVMLVEMPLVFRMEGRKSALWFIRMGSILYAVSYFCFVIPSISAILASVLYMILISFGEVFIMPFSSSWVTKRAGDRYQGQFMALYGVAYSVANVAAPALGTRIIAWYGYTTLWWMVGLLALVSFVGFSWVKES